MRGWVESPQGVRPVGARRGVRDSATPPDSSAALISCTTVPAALLCLSALLLLGSESEEI